MYSDVRSALYDEEPYKLTFRVKDLLADSLLQNISVIVGEGEQITAANGEAQYIMNKGNYNYRISHPDYATIESSMEVSNDTVVQISLTQSKKRIVFSIYSENMGNPLSNTSVVVGGTEISTGLNGAAIFHLLKGPYEYTISHPDYFTSSSSLQLSNDTTIQISLVATRADIKFRIYSEDKPLYNVSLKLEGDSLTTNSIGIVLFKDMPRFEEYDWSASKEGFEDIEGTLSLMNDTIVNLYMNLHTNTDYLGLQGLSLYPNPTHSKLLIESVEIIKRVDICDLRGALLSSKQATNSNITIDISDYQSGIYIARIYRDGQRTVNLKVIKSDE